MDVIAYLGTVVAICGLAIGAMYVIVGLLGKRIDELRTDMDARFDALTSANDARLGGLEAQFAGIDSRFARIDSRFSGIESRLARLGSQNDSIIEAVAALGQRVAQLE
jgi:hypothetical protein